MTGLDIAAGVLSIVTAGLTVAKGLVEIADSIGSAGEEVRLCAAETALFSRMLNDLSDALTKPTAASRATQNTTEDLVDICERILKPFEALLSRLSPLLESYRDSEHQLRQLSLRIQWHFRHKSKVVFYQQALGRLKMTLTCLLASMNYQEARVNAPQLIFICQAEVRTSKASIEQQQQTDRATPMELASEFGVGQQLLLSDVMSEQDADPQDIEEREASQGSDRRIVNLGDLSTEDMPDIDSDIDEDTSSKTAIAVHDDLLSLQRKVLRIAENNLKPSNVATPAIALLGQSSIPKSTRDGSIEGETMTESSSDDRSETSGQVTDKPVILHDPSGKKFALPFSKCRTWDSMKDAMADIYVGYPALRNSIGQGDYVLYLDDEVLVSSVDWEAIVGPGMSFTLRTVSKPVAASADEDGDSSSSRSDALPHNFRKIAPGADDRVLLWDSTDETVYHLPFSECKTFKVFEDNLRHIYDPTKQENERYFDEYLDFQPYKIYHKDTKLCIPLHLFDKLIQPGYHIMLKFDNHKLNELAYPPGPEVLRDDRESLVEDKTKGRIGRKIWR